MWSVLCKQELWNCYPDLIVTLPGCVVSSFGPVCHRNWSGYDQNLKKERLSNWSEGGGKRERKAFQNLKGSLLGNGTPGAISLGDGVRCSTVHVVGG